MIPPSDPRHGSNAGYCAGCRCIHCTHAAAVYHKTRVYDHMRGIPRKVPAAGTQRRLTALAALGWTFADIADQLGCQRQALHGFLRETTVYAATAAAVARVYDDLSMGRPEGRYATRTRGWAASNGWPPPLAWEGIDIDDPAAVPDRGAPTDDQVDEVVVLRALDGDRAIHLTRAERFELVARARARGWTLRDIEQRTSITKPERYLTAGREDAA